jgi:hypothetical protein
MWYFRNQSNITWFIIGWLVTSGLRDLMMGNFFGAFLSFLFAYINYALSR